MIELEAHAVKGIGKTHAKWSPVAPVWYRMLPEVRGCCFSGIGKHHEYDVEVIINDF